MNPLRIKSVLKKQKEKAKEEHEHTQGKNMTDGTRGFFQNHYNSSSFQMWINLHSVFDSSNPLSYPQMRCTYDKKQKEKEPQEQEEILQVRKRGKRRETAATPWLILNEN
jgi:hypothetical protein